MAGTTVEHPNSDSDTEFTASTNQEVCLARIEQLRSWIDPNVLWTSGLDDKDLGGSDVPDGANEVGERDGDGGELEWLGDVCIENGIKESGQLDRVLLDQRRNVYDPCSRDIGREFEGLASLFVVNIETEGGDNIADNNEVNAASGIENDVESFSTGCLEPLFGRRQNRRGGDIYRDRLHVNAELGGQDLNLTLRRDGEERGNAQALDNLDSGPSGTCK